MSPLNTPIRIALLASLCLNLLLAAVTGSVLWRERSASDAAAPVEARSLPDPRRIARALPPERRALVREALAPDRAAFVADVRALRDAHARVRLALRAQPYDELALGAALADVRERERTMAERVHGGLLRLSAQLTEDERAQLAERLPRRDRHRMHEDGQEPRGQRPHASSESENRRPQEVD